MVGAGTAGDVLTFGGAVLEIRRPILMLLGYRGFIAKAVELQRTLDSNPNMIRKLRDIRRREAESCELCALVCLKFLGIRMRRAAINASER